MDEVEIVSMIESDLDEVIRIEDSSFPVPWSRNLFLREIKLKFSKNYIIKIEENNWKRLIGYVCTWWIADEIHIMNIAIDADYRLRGFGKKLLTFCLEKAKLAGIKVATLEVRESNKEAIRLYEKLGFEKYGIRKRYYAESNENALIMVREEL